MSWIKNYKQQQLTINNIRQLNYIVICLLILVAIFSIIWSLSLHVLFDDFYNGFADVSLAFSERDLTQLKNDEKATLEHDLKKINRIYYEDLPELIEHDQIKTEALIMPKINITTTEQTKFPTKSTKNSSNGKLLINDLQKKYGNNNITETQLQLLKDYEFLTHMTINIQRTHWKNSLAAYFIYNFPYLSEIVAIVWTVLSFVYQSGVKKQWGLPKPWLIVIPSIIIFTLMVITNLAYMLLANGYLDKACHELKANLNKPELISCGDAISLLKPLIRPHDFCHDTYLILYRSSYILTLIFWIIALLLMVVRFLLAIDFRLVDLTVQHDPENDLPKQECVEILVDAPHNTTQSFKEQTKSEDDFQSAKSQVSEAAIPLLETLTNTYTLKT